MSYLPSSQTPANDLSASIMYALVYLLAFSLSLSPEHAHASNIPSFDIDLKYLKAKSASKPAVNQPFTEIPPKAIISTKSSKNKKHKAPKQKKRTIRNTYQNITFPKPATDNQHKAALLESLPSPDSIPVQTSDLTLTLKSSVNSCDILQQLLKTRLFSTTSQPEVLTSLPQIGFYAVRGRKSKAAITCGLSSADELTYGRLLSIHDTRIINIKKNDPPEVIVNKLTTNLGYATQSFRTTLNNKKVYYVFSECNEKGLFISIP